MPALSLTRARVGTRAVVFGHHSRVEVCMQMGGREWANARACNTRPRIHPLAQTCDERAWTKECAYTRGAWRAGGGVRSVVRSARSVRRARSRVRACVSAAHTYRPRTRSALCVGKTSLMIRQSGLELRCAVVWIGWGLHVMIECICFSSHMISPPMRCTHQQNSTLSWSWRLRNTTNTVHIATLQAAPQYSALCIAISAP